MTNDNPPIPEGTEPSVNLNDLLVLRDWDSYDLGLDSKLDKFDLDTEATRQAEYMNKWISLLHKAQIILSKAKEVLNHVEAELRIDAKKNGIEGITKVTDATIEAWIVTQKKYQVAFADKCTAEANVQYLQNARQVLENKRDMIKVLDHLWVAGYYARPNVSEAVKEVGLEQVDSVTKATLAESIGNRRL